MSSFRRDARKIARTVETIEKIAEKYGPRVGEPTATGTATFEAGEAPQCTKAQRVWVREVLKLAHRQGVIVDVPELPEDLGLDQAEQILTSLGSPVEELYRMGRDLGGRKDQAGWRATR